MTGWLFGGVVLLAVIYALTRRREPDDAVSDEWVKTQIRERGVRRQA